MFPFPAVCMRMSSWSSERYEKHRNHRGLFAIVIFNSELKNLLTTKLSEETRIKCSNAGVKIELKEYWSSTPVARQFDSRVAEKLSETKQLTADHFSLPEQNHSEIHEQVLKQICVVHLTSVRETNSQDDTLPSSFECKTPGQLARHVALSPRFHCRYRACLPERWSSYSKGNPVLNSWLWKCQTEFEMKSQHSHCAKLWLL